MNYFYQPNMDSGSHFLDAEEFTHCTRVLRNKIGDEIGVLDGKGGFYETEIISISGKKADLKILNESRKAPKKFYHHIAIAPTKNIDRLEWFVEKACELGIDEISLIITKNSERTKVRVDRLGKKALSALKQSKSGYLTTVNELVKFSQFIKVCKQDHSEKFLAYVESGLPYFSTQLKPNSRILTMIGPEGDFDPSEVALAKDAGFSKISLGSNTLRTETAGLAACQFVNFINAF